MAGPTVEQIEYTHDLLGVNPNDYPAAGSAPGAAPGAGAPPPAPWSFSATKAPAISLQLDPHYAEAVDEATAWVKKYLDGAKLAAVPGQPTSGDGAQLSFAGKVTPLARIIATTVAAGRLGDLKLGDIAHRQIDERFVGNIIAGLFPAAAPDDPAAPEKKKDDDGIDTTVELGNKDVQTNIQFTIKLRAVGDDDPRRVVLLPDIEITLQVGKDASTSTVEAQLNLVKVKQDVSKHLSFNGHVIVDSIEFKTGISGEAGMTDVALAQIGNSLKAKIKSELEFKVSKSVSVSLEADIGQGGTTIIPKLVFHF